VKVNNSRNKNYRASSTDPAKKNYRAASTDPAKRNMGNSSINTNNSSAFRIKKTKRPMSGNNLYK
jgi:hypothetical protein